MKTSTPITDFLLARIAEREAVARDLQHQALQGRQVVTFNGGGTGVRELVDPARVLADCEAKRRIVEDLVLPYVAERRRLMNGQPSRADEHPDLIRLLTLPFTDHPDYREEWRP